MTILLHFRLKASQLDGYFIRIVEYKPCGLQYSVNYLQNKTVQDVRICFNFISYYHLNFEFQSIILRGLNNT